MTEIQVTELARAVFDFYQLTKKPKLPKENIKKFESNISLFVMILYRELEN